MIFCFFPIHISLCPFFIVPFPFQKNGFIFPCGPFSRWTYLQKVLFSSGMKISDQNFTRTTSPNSSLGLSLPSSLSPHFPPSLPPLPDNFGPGPNFGLILGTFPIDLDINFQIRGDPDDTISVFKIFHTLPPPRCAAAFEVQIQSRVLIANQTI